MSFGGTFFGGAAFGAPAFGPDQIVKLGGSATYSGAPYSSRSYSGFGASRSTSSEAFGRPTVTVSAVPVTVSMQGAASAGAVGSPTVVPGAVTVLIGGVTAGSPGQPTITTTVSRALAGSSSSETAGNPTVVPGAVTRQVTSSSSTEAFGLPTLAQIIHPAGGPTSEDSGLSTVVGTLDISLGGVSSSEAAGTPTLAATFVIVLQGAVSTEAAGQPTINTTIAAGVAAASSGEALGNPTVVGVIALGLVGPATAEAFGEPTVSWAQTVLLVGPATTEAFGEPIVEGAATTTPLPNDDLADATVLTGTEGSITTDTLDASTYETDEPNVRNEGSQDASIWYVWQAPDDGEFWVNLLGSVDADGGEIDLYLYLYSADTATPAMADLVYETEGDDYDAEDGNTYLASGLDAVPVTAGRYYFLQAQSYSGLEPGSVIHVNWSNVGAPDGPPPPPPPPPPPAPAGAVTLNLGDIGLDAAVLIDAVRLNTTMVALVYVATSDHSLYVAYAWVTDDADDPILFSVDPAQIHGAYTNIREFSVSRIDDSRVLVVYQSDDMHGTYAVVVTSVSQSPVVGTPFLVTASATGATPSAASKLGTALSATRAVVCWWDFWASQQVTTVLSISGSTLAIVGEGRADSPTVLVPEEFLGISRGKLLPAGGMSFWAFLYGTEPYELRNRLCALLTVNDAGAITINPGPIIPMEDPNNSWWRIMGHAVDPSTGNLVVAFADGRYDGAPGLAFVDPSDMNTLTTIASASDGAALGLINSGFAISPAGVLLAGSWQYDPPGDQTSVTNTFRLEAYDLPNARSAGAVGAAHYARYQDTSGGGRSRQVESWDTPIIPLGDRKFILLTSVNEFTVH